jgi:hypothetical protein
MQNTGDMVPDVRKQPAVKATAANAEKLLAHRLNNDHNRMTVTKNMQQKMMAMFESTV